METLQLKYEEDKAVRYPIRLFVHGESHKLLGLIETDIHLFGVEEPGGIFLFGTDSIGRDLFSRTLHGARLSLSIGLVGVALSFVIGITLGGISGYFGGAVDTFIQRVIEFLISMPTIPLWLALSAALPRDWPVARIYFGIVVILSLVGWGGLARVVRGKFLELRELDYVLAARVSGVSEWSIIRVHLMPNFASYLIVHVTLAIPEMILGETALSFLGLGLRTPAVSWGVLLEKAQNIHSVAIYWWTVIPALFVITTVMAFNFLGDGLRDAADPYKQ
jgi:peptide/nickel transport system permease protein